MWPHIHYIHWAAFAGFIFSVRGIIVDSYLRRDGTDFTLLFLSIFGTRKSEYHLFQVWPSLTSRASLEKTIRFFISLVHRCNFHCINLFIYSTLSIILLYYITGRNDNISNPHSAHSYQYWCLHDFFSRIKYLFGSDESCCWLLFDAK